MFYACSTYNDGTHSTHNAPAPVVGEVDYVSLLKHEVVHNVAIEQNIPVNSKFFETVSSDQSPVVLLAYSDRTKQTLVYVVVDESHPSINNANLDVRYTP